MEGGNHVSLGSTLATCTGWGDRYGRAVCNGQLIYFKRVVVTLFFLMLRPRYERMVLASCILSVTLLCMMVPLSQAQMDIPESDLKMCELCNVFTSRSLQGLNTHVARCVKKHRVLPTSGGAGGGAGGKNYHHTQSEIPAPVSKPPNLLLVMS